jgi:hypothetical protein
MRKKPRIWQWRLRSRSSTAQLVIEDDGRTGYAYLLRDRKIVSDVWLYNRAPTPEKAAWESPEQSPLINPRPFARAEHLFSLPNRKFDLSIGWRRAGDGSLEAEIRLRGQIIAKLIEDEKPGASLMAAKDGPLARMLKRAVS